LQEYGVEIFYPVPTKSAWKKAIKKGHVYVNGQAADTANWIKGGEEIELIIPDPPKPRKQLRLKLKVLYEDAFLAAVSKPAGILVSGNSFYTVDNGLEQNLNSSTEKDACRPRPVHRLDYATTGILLIGKTRDAIRKLNGMFEDKAMRKSYLAVTIGFMEDHARIEETIDGRDAITEYNLLRHEESERFERLNLVEVNPLSGRRHQIRKHLAGMGNPILGDRDYGREGLILKGKGLYLHHAHSLEFRHPFTNESIKIIDPMPERFGKIFS
jgi:23S rRNA pseudouridine1911/1915/1917 synthase